MKYGRVHARYLRMLSVALGLLLIALAAAPVCLAAGKGEPGSVVAVRIDLRPGENDLRRLTLMGIDVDGVFDGWARAYVLLEELEKLRKLGYSVRSLPPEPSMGLIAPLAGEEPVSTDVPSSYHTYESLTTELQAIAAAYPSITRLFSVGQSVQGRELWMMKISDNPDLEEDEPEAAYISSMHGDEVVGKELCVNLINLLVEGYGTDPRVRDLVDETEIWILPSMNPDGTALVRRYNANGVDLNRDFPDQFTDPVDSSAGRQPETAAVMSWSAAHSVDLAANFHGGALVANYPFDGNASVVSTFSPTPEPDHSTFVSIARTYADKNPPMSMNNSDPAFDNGITNGAEWYVIYGGMQDWAYVWRGTRELTLEVGNDKWPSPTLLPQYWSENAEAMLSYLERAREGLRGRVTDAETGTPLAASVRLDADPFATYTDPDVGDYHRIVVPGDYTMRVEAEGYATELHAVNVGAGSATRLDVALQPLPTNLQPVGQRVLDGAAGNGVLDPDETSAVAVSLVNLGHAASGVQARLMPTGWYAEVPRAQAAYPDLATGESAESLAPYHEVHVDPAVPPGHKLGFALAWEAAEGRGVSEPMFLDVGPATCATPAATDVPQAILDHATATSTIDVSLDGAVDEIRVTVEILHTYIGDLVVSLTSPQGTTVLLHDRSGGMADNIVGTYPLELTPAEPLDVLLDQPSAGSWQLTVSDLVSGDTGSLEAWSLALCTRPVEAQTPEMRFRELVDQSGAVLLGWWPYPGLTSYRVYRSTDPSSSAAFIDVTALDDDATDTVFSDDASTDPLVFYLVSGVGPQGEGPKGHFGE